LLVNTVPTFCTHSIIAVLFLLSISEVDAQNDSIPSSENKAYENQPPELEKSDSTETKEFAKEFGSETITVTAAPRVQAVQDVPISVSAIQGDMMKLRTTTTLDQALQYVPGVEINQDNISIRGSSGFSFGIGSRAVLLLDGFPMIAADNGDIKFDAMPVFNIQRIEVVKGSGSALYGTSAIGGVINIITEKPSSEGSLKTRVYSGLYPQSNYEQWQFSDSPTLDHGLDIAYTKAYEDIEVSFNAGAVDATGHRDYNESNRWNAYLNTVWKSGDFTRIRLLTGYAREKKDDWIYWRGVDSATFPAYRQDYRVIGAPESEPFTKITSDKITAMASINHIFDNGSFINARSGVFITSFNNGLEGLTVPEENLEEFRSQIRESDATAWNSEIQYNSSIYEDFFLTLGSSAQLNIVDSKNFGNNTQAIYSGYAQVEVSAVEDMTITFGARLDQEQTDTISSPLQFSPKLGVSWKPFSSLSLRGNLGRGFRAPIIAERYASANFQGFSVIPNLDLKPETSWSYELGGTYTYDEFGFPIIFDAAGFLNQMNDLIEPTFDEDGKLKFANIVNAEIRGIEVAVRSFLWEKIGLETSVTLLDPRNTDTDDYLNYRGNLLWYSRLLIPWENLIFSFDYRYKTPFESTDLLLASQVSDANVYNAARVLDARVRYDMQNDTGWPVSLTLNIANALNYNYTVMVGNLAPTRFIQLTLESEL